MKRFDRLLAKIACNSEKKLKSEEIFDKYTEAKAKLENNVLALTNIIEGLKKDQLDMFNFKEK